MKAKLNSNLVSVDWLNLNNDADNLILLDATINKSIDTDSIKIPDARFFDIKNNFSKSNAPFPSTLPSAEQFQKESRRLGVNNNSIIIVYDDKGIYSSARAWWLYKAFGFKNVAVLNGGLPEWIKNGFQTVNYTDENYKLGDFEAHLNSNLMTDFQELKKQIVKPDSLIIDARSKDRFQCLVPEPREGLRRGTIPNSKNLPYSELFDKNKLKPKEKLQSIFHKLVEDKSKLIFSCGSGITACILALAAAECNYKNLTVYDGSWTEYGSLTTS